MSQNGLEIELMANKDFSKPRRIPALIDQGNGEALPIGEFVFDPSPRRWRVKAELIADYVSAHHGSKISDAELPEAAEVVLNDLGFAVPVTAKAKPEANDTDDGDKPATALAEGEKGKRGRKSKFPYKTCAVGESFLVPAEAVTLTHSMVGDNKFALSIEGGKFRFERIA